MSSHCNSVTLLFLTLVDRDFFSRKVTTVSTVWNDLTGGKLVVEVEDRWFNDDAVVDEHAKDEKKEADEVRPSKLLPLDTQRKAPDDDRSDRIENFSGNNCLNFS